MKKLITVSQKLNAAALIALASSALCGAEVAVDVSQAGDFTNWAEAQWLPQAPTAEDSAVVTLKQYGLYIAGGSNIELANLSFVFESNANVLKVGDIDGERTSLNISGLFTTTGSNNVSSFSFANADFTADSITTSYITTADFTNSTLTVANNFKSGNLSTWNFSDSTLTFLGNADFGNNLNMHMKNSEMNVAGSFLSEFINNANRKVTIEDSQVRIHTDSNISVTSGFGAAAFRGGTETELIRSQFDVLSDGFKVYANSKLSLDQSTINTDWYTQEVGTLSLLNSSINATTDSSGGKLSIEGGTISLNNSTLKADSIAFTKSGETLNVTGTDAATSVISALTNGNITFASNYVATFDNVSVHGIISVGNGQNISFKNSILANSDSGSLSRELFRLDDQNASTFTFDNSQILPDENGERIMSLFVGAAPTESSPEGHVVRLTNNSFAKGATLDETTGFVTKGSFSVMGWHQADNRSIALKIDGGSRFWGGNFELGKSNNVHTQNSGTYSISVDGLEGSEHSILNPTFAALTLDMGLSTTAGSTLKSLFSVKSNSYVNLGALMIGNQSLTESDVKYGVAGGESVFEIVGNGSTVRVKGDTNIKWSGDGSSSIGEAIGGINISGNSNVFEASNVYVGRNASTSEGSRYFSASGNGNAISISGTLTVADAASSAGDSSFFVASSNADMRSKLDIGGKIVANISTMGSSKAKSVFEIGGNTDFTAAGDIEVGITSNAQSGESLFSISGTANKIEAANVYIGRSDNVGGKATLLVEGSKHNIVFAGLFLSASSTDTLQNQVGGRLKMVSDEFGVSSIYAEAFDMDGGFLELDFSKLQVAGEVQFDLISSASDISYVYERIISDSALDVKFANDGDSGELLYDGDSNTISYKYFSTVVPEASECALIFGALALALVFFTRRRN